jgi:flagellar biosynthesis/type III secretory pathway chaperone
MDQRKAVVKWDIKALEDAGDAKEKLLFRFTKLEAQRTKVMAKLAAAMALPQSNLTLKKIVGLIREPYVSDLNDVRANLGTVLQGVRKISQDNLALFKHSHRLVQSSLALLNKSILNSCVYHSSGKIRNTTFNGTLLSGEI